MLIHLIAAARPNFMKIAPLYHALKKEDWADPRIVHTGQHYDLNIFKNFSYFMAGLGACLGLATRLKEGVMDG